MAHLNYSFLFEQGNGWSNSLAMMSKRKFLQENCHSQFPMATSHQWPILYNFYSITLWIWLTPMLTSTVNMYLPSSWNFVNKSFMKLVEEEISQSLLHFYFVSVKNGNEAEDEDGEWYWRRSGPKLFEICIRFFMKYMTLGSKTILDTLYKFFVDYNYIAWLY